MNSFQLQKWNIYNWHESSSFQKPKHVSGGLYALFSAQERDWPRKRDSREMQSDWCSRYSVMENGMISAPKISLFSPILDAIPSHLMKRKSQTKQKCIPSGTRAIGKGILGIWEWLNPFIAPRFRGPSTPTSWFLWLKHSHQCHISLHEQDELLSCWAFVFLILGDLFSHSLRFRSSSVLSEWEKVIVISLECTDLNGPSFFQGIKCDNFGLSIFRPRLFLSLKLCHSKKL